MRFPDRSPALDKNRAPMGPEMLSSTGAGVCGKAPKAFQDSSSVLDKFQSAIRYLSTIVHDCLRLSSFCDKKLPPRKGPNRATKVQNCRRLCTNGREWPESPPLDFLEPSRKCRWGGRKFPPFGRFSSLPFLFGCTPIGVM